MRLCKTGIIALLALSAMAFFSCASSKKVVYEEVEEEPVYMTEAEKKAAERKKAEAELLEIGWTKKSSKNVDATYGNIRLRSRKGLGTFNIGLVNENGKTVSVLSTANEYMTTSFYLKAGKKIIRLNQNSSVKTYSRKTENGMQLVYVVDKVAYVVLDFNCFASDPKSDDINTVKVTCAVQNIGKKKEEFAVKMVLDTVLGETDRHHFYDSEGEPVKSERELRNLTEDDWFVSQNMNGTMLFTFAGLDATEPNLVAMANFSTLDSSSWNPNMLDYRSFDTILSYNNSAVGAVWKDKKLLVEDTTSETFYITLSASSNRLYENILLTDSGSSDKKTASKENNTESKTPQAKPVENTKQETTSAPVKETAKVPEKEPVKEPVKETVQEPVKEPINEPVKEPEKQTAENKKDSKYSPEYIQAILDKIDMLKEDGTANQAEIEALNKELDSIFGALVN